MEEQSQEPGSAAGLTKAQKYEQRRRAKEEAHRQKSASQSKGRYLRWTVLALIVVAGIYGLTKLPQTAAPAATSGMLSDAVGASDWTRGNTASPLTLLEYSDFQCPACGSYHPIMQQLLAEYGDRVRFSSRHFPLAQHKFAQAAARAAEAAGRQGKFWEMHDMLFANQASWSGQSDPAATFAQYAVTLGLKTDQWQADLESSEIREKIAAQYAGGVRSGVNSTPTFFLNDQKLDQPRGLDDFKKAIDKALAEP